MKLSFLFHFQSCERWDHRAIRKCYCFRRKATRLTADFVYSDEKPWSMAALENVMGPVQSCQRTRSKGWEDSSRYDMLGKDCVGIFSNFVWDSEDDQDKIEAVEEKFKAYCAPPTSRHFNRYLFIQRKQQDGETVEFCSTLKTLAKNSDLCDKEESWITSMLVLGL